MLYVDARAPLARNCEIHDLVSKFADRVEDSTQKQMNQDLTCVMTEADFLVYTLLASKRRAYALNKRIIVWHIHIEPL